MAEAELAEACASPLSNAVCEESCVDLESDDEDDAEPAERVLGDLRLLYRALEGLDGPIEVEVEPRQATPALPSWPEQLAVERRAFQAVPLLHEAELLTLRTAPLGARVARVPPRGVRGRLGVTPLPLEAEGWWDALLRAFFEKLGAAPALVQHDRPRSAHHAPSRRDARLKRSPRPLPPTGAARAQPVRGGRAPRLRAAH